ncbi:hypothetical protein HHK36_019485 [Tetracentron sinense]|uniref:DOCKER domain-containing protein n=1 Tax=Tetracentron sinense TaxID=13715 RepID=A0A835DCB4_TETSI|nr:hypothetical protein HHK36_019485 [Tetracentron sinense]
MDEIIVFYNLNAVEKREVLIVILQIIHNLDDASLVKAWQQSIARTKLFFRLLEDCLILFEQRKPADIMLMGSSSRSLIGEGPTSPKYSDRLSPATNNYLSEASRKEVRELLEENLSAAVSLQVLEITEKFSIAAASHNIATDYFFRNDNVRKRAVIGLQILVRSSFYYRFQTRRLRVILTITLSELMTDVQVTEMKSDGALQESSEALRLRKSLQEMADENRSFELLKECVLPENALVAIGEVVSENRWSWSEVKYLSDSLLLALDASLEHALLASEMTVDRYAAAESFYKLAMAYASVPDLHIIWLLRLCDAHLEMQSWAEAAQCAVAVAGVVMQALVGRNVDVWSRDHVVALRKICAVVSSEITVEASVAEVEGYGASNLTIDSATKYLRLAYMLFSQAGLHHFCASIQELIISVYKIRRGFG